MRKYLKILLLKIPAFWYLEAEWDWSNEYDYIRKPRRFYKNKLFKEYLINHIFTKNPKDKSYLIKQFVSDFKTNRLIQNDLCVVL